MAGWLWTLIFFALLITYYITSVGSSLARVTYEASQVLLAGDQVVFLRYLHFCPTLQLTWLNIISQIILKGCKPHIKI